MRVKQMNGWIAARPDAARARTPRRRVERDMHAPCRTRPTTPGVPDSHAVGLFLRYPAEREWQAVGGGGSLLHGATVRSLRRLPRLNRALQTRPRPEARHPGAAFVPPGWNERPALPKLTPHSLGRYAKPIQISCRSTSLPIAFGRAREVVFWSADTARLLLVDVCVASGREPSQRRAPAASWRRRARGANPPSGTASRPACCRGEPRSASARTCCAGEFDPAPGLDGGRVAGLPRKLLHPGVG